MVHILHSWNYGQPLIRWQMPQAEAAVWMDSFSP